MKTIEVNTYSFSELSDDIKEAVINNFRDISTDYYDWYEDTIYDAKEIGKLIGIDIDKIYFSGFSSQGDGACFEGSYCYEKQSVKKIKEYAPLDKELHEIAKNLADIQKKYFYSLSANVAQRGHYMHENCTYIIVNDDFNEREANTEAADGIAEFLRDFMRWIYKQLEIEYEWLTSDDTIVETINANEYMFTSDGELI